MDTATRLDLSVEVALAKFVMEPEQYDLMLRLQSAFLHADVARQQLQTLHSLVCGPWSRPPSQESLADDLRGMFLAYHADLSDAQGVLFQIYHRLFPNRSFSGTVHDIGAEILEGVL